MALKRYAAPACDPVSLAEAKKALRVDHDEHDALIEDLVTGVTESLDGPEGELGRALVDQTWDLTLDSYPAAGSAIEIPLPPLIDVESVWTIGDDGAETELDAADWRLIEGEPARLVTVPKGSSWPTGGVRVRFRAGYLDLSWSPPVDAVPFKVRQAIKLRVQALYDGKFDDKREDAIRNLLKGAVFHVGIG